MRKEGNSIILSKNEQYYSCYDNEMYCLMTGSIQIFVVEWFDADMTIDRQAGRGVALSMPGINADEKIEIPSFCYTELGSGKMWKFCLKATEDDTRFEIRPGATQKLKQNFLIKAGIDSYEKEGGRKGHGFENSLIAFYRGRQAKEAAQIHTGGELDQQTKEEGLKTIAGGMNESDQNIIRAGSSIYKTVYFAAKKCGISVIAEEEKVMAECGKENLTVPDIARASHFICREVTLDMDWYRNDCGVMITYLPVEKDTDGKKKKEKHPIACYLKGSQYYYFDIETGSEKPLKKDIADTFEAKAYSIRRTLPNRKVTAKDVVSFVIKGIQSRDIVQLVVLGVVCTLIGVLLPKLNQLIYDEYIPMGNTNLLSQICFVIVSCMIGKVFISIVKTLQEYRIPARAGYELQDAVYHRIFELPEKFFRDYDSAELANRIAGVAGITNALVSNLFTNGFTLIISVIYWIQMLRYSGKLTLVCLIMLIVYGTLIFLISRNSVKHIKQIEEYKGDADGKLFQFISGVDKIRMAGAEERAVLEYSTPVANEKRLSIKTGRNGAVLSVLTDAGSIAFTMVLYYMMIRSKIGIGIGAFMAFTTAFGSVSSAALGFVQGLTEYLQLKPVIKRAAPVFQAVPEDDLNKDIVTDLTGNISVDHVTFGYAKDQTPVLNDLSIRISSGEYVAIVGPSGCGKSTLLKLLLGFETPDTGRVLYDGKDIASINKHSLRKKTGVVLQNGKLIAGSIFENITITSAKPDISKVWKTIDDVGLREDIEGMPMGIHTMLSESGGTISGGQQQRILIARAIYNDPKVLFFDEATSALDNITQAKICESLEKRNMTRVVIAHRLSTVRKCDRIIVLDQGKVVEEGNFEDLMRLKGRFYEMAIRQIV